MKPREATTVVAVSAGHMLLLWALMAGVVASSGPVPPWDSQVRPGLVVVSLHLPQPQVDKPAAPRPADPGPLPAVKPALALPGQRDVANGPVPAQVSDSAASAGLPPSLAAQATAAAANASPAGVEQAGGLSAVAPERLNAVLMAAAPAAPEQLPPPVSARADHRHCPPAAHPAALRERGIEGAVLLRVKVDMRGRAADVQLLAGSGWRLFDDAALQQVRGCRFLPATHGGRAVDSWVEFPVNFSLNG